MTISSAVPSPAQPAWIARYARKITTAAAAMSRIERGRRLFIGSGCAKPATLVDALADHAGHLADNPVIHILTLGTAPYVDPRYTESFRHNAFFVGPNVRAAISEGRADYTPIFLSEIPNLFRSGKLPIDVALISVSPPDEHGFCSYGVSVDVVKSATESARIVVAEVNERMPRALGDSFIHVNQINALVPANYPLPELKHDAPDHIARRIGEHIADLIEDGSTMQMGIGSIPDALLAFLKDKKDLGIHTEMFSEGVIELVEKGVINGRRKTMHPGKIVASFIMGSQRLYDFVDNNPMIEFRPTEYTNDPFLVAQNDRMVAINSALQVDLTGQVCADSLGTYFYSGIGGQVDFIRGASRSRGGKPIIALPSTARDGKVSRISTILTPGAGVVTSRGDVHYVVTEWGAADLHGKCIRDRALALIHIAHPDFREELMRDAHERHWVSSTQTAVLKAGSEDLEDYVSKYKLPDGHSVDVRPIHPTDQELEREMFYAFSEQTVYHRFFAPLKRIGQERIEQFTCIDYSTQMALVAIQHEGAADHMLGVGRYVLNPATNTAEVAFAVRDGYHRMGLGRYLFDQLKEIARQRGIKTILAAVLPDNGPMLQLFHQCATGPVSSRLEDGVYVLTFDLQTSDATAAETELTTA